MKKLIFLCFVLCSFSLNAFFVEGALAIFFAGAATVSTIKTVSSGIEEHRKTHGGPYGPNLDCIEYKMEKLDDKYFNEKELLKKIPLKIDYWRLKYPKTIFAAGLTVGASLLALYFWNLLKEEKKRAIKTRLTICAD